MTMERWVFMAAFMAAAIVLRWYFSKLDAEAKREKERRRLKLVAKHAYQMNKETL